MAEKIDDVTRVVFACLDFREALGDELLDAARRQRSQSEALLPLLDPTFFQQVCHDPKLKFGDELVRVSLDAAGAFVHEGGDTLSMAMRMRMAHRPVDVPRPKFALQGLVMELEKLAEDDEGEPEDKRILCSRLAARLRAIEENIPDTGGK